MPNHFVNPTLALLVSGMFVVQLNAGQVSSKPPQGQSSTTCKELKPQTVITATFTYALKNPDKIKLSVPIQASASVSLTKRDHLDQSDEDLFRVHIPLTFKSPASSGTSDPVHFQGEASLSQIDFSSLAAGDYSFDRGISLGGSGTVGKDTSYGDQPFSGMAELSAGDRLLCFHVTNDKPGPRSPEFKEISPAVITVQGH